MALENEDVTNAIIGSAIEVHRQLGPGLLESAYKQCMCFELSRRNIAFQLEMPLPIRYKDVLIDCEYRIDLMVDERVVVELKSVEKVLPVHHAQLMTYLKLSGKRVGLLINFNVPVLKDGIVRRVL